MWPFSKKRYSILDSGVLRGMTDCHCHILPGVDDGIRTMEEALKALQQMSELGIREVWLTPHIMEDYPNTPADLRRRFENLNDNLNVNDNFNENEVHVHLAAEHMLDTLFMERFAADDLLPHSSQLLVETSYFHPPMGLYDILERIRQKDYTPLLAHPERYMYMEAADYRRLLSMGVRLQLNILSLAGAYGEDAARKAHQLLYQGAYSCLGTDLHRLSDFMDYASEACLSEKDILIIQSIQTISF